MRDAISLCVSFVGIRVSNPTFFPFQEAPIGPLRFKDPVPRTPLEQPLDAVQFGASCPQLDIVGTSSLQEDCLVRLIFTINFIVDQIN